MPSSPEIFISYAWGGSREDIVNAIYDHLCGKGYNVVRDKVSLGYRGSIKKFMEQIGVGKAVIIVISEKYLQSRNCMFEALEIRQHGAIEKRIFPVILPDADIYDAPVNKKYCQFWNAKIATLNQKLSGMANQAYRSSLLEEIDLFTDIRNFIEQFVQIIAEIEVLTPQDLELNGFEQLTNALDKLFVEDRLARSI